uniref:Uncharacterized protein n=1 Tax=Leersia perrieri TaxID=77586 RepID=A0A0D9W9E4_9ORYZ
MDSQVKEIPLVAAGGSKLRRRLARLRYRRLRKNQYLEAYHKIFNVRDLVDLVEQGKCSTVEAYALKEFLHRLGVFDRFTHGVCRTPLLHARIVQDDDGHTLSSLYPCYFTLASHFLSDQPQAAMDMLDWQLVRSKAAKIAKAMSYKVPEIISRLPRARANIFPLASPYSSSVARRRHVKERRAERDVILQCYLEKMKSILLKICWCLTNSILILLKIGSNKLCSINHIIDNVFTTLEDSGMVGRASVLWFGTVEIKRSITQLQQLVVDLECKFGADCGAGSTLVPSATTFSPAMAQMHRGLDASIRSLYDGTELSS